MTTFERIKLEHLTKKEKQIYKKMLSPGIEHPAIDPKFLDPEESQIAIGAFIKKKPIGLLIGKPMGDKVWEIASLFVDPEYRRRKIGTHLMGEFEKEIKHKKISSLIFNYPNRLIPEIDPFLNSLGWGGRHAFAVECFFQDVRDFHPPWFDRVYKEKNKDFEFFPWQKLPLEEKQKLLEKEQSGRFPSYYNPFQRKDFDPNTSFGLRYKGELAGWCITQEFEPKFLDFFCLYSNYDLQTKGIPIQLLIHSIKAAQNTPFSARFFINFKQVSMRWIRTVAKRLAPYATRVTLYHQAWKSLVKKIE